MQLQFFLAVIFYLISIIASNAQTGKDSAIRGRELSEGLCSLCHAVGPDPASSGKTEIPSFYSIANRPNQNAQNLVASIIFPHPEMPKISFTNKELKDIAEYILSLRSQK
ncbi:MAG: c-type cytochrome [Hyphomicrobium sp.]